MNALEPQLQKAPGRTGHARGRWRWWYAAICDYRLAHPGCTNIEVATALKKGPNTIGSIINTDLYREYEAQRRQHWRSENENTLRQKLMGVTMKALDAMEIQLDKRRDQIPLKLAQEVVATGLESLGFGPTSAPSVVINNRQEVVLPNAVSPLALEEARMALRAVEARRIMDHSEPLLIEGKSDELQKETGSHRDSLPDSDVAVVEEVNLGTSTSDS